MIYALKIMKLDRLKKFYGKQARFYDATRWMFLFNRKKAIELLDLKSSHKVLDLACGTGLNIPYLAKKLGL